MPKIHVSRKQQIDAPVEEVFAAVRDFKCWEVWSPWLIAERSCGVSYSEEGDSYSWDGKIIGAGEMAVLAEEEGKWISQDLTFLKPFKSKAAVRFDFAEKDGGTEVTWTMDSSLPFFMFFFRSMMEAFIGMDYERGLMMLKQYVETGEVHSQLEFSGTEAFGGCAYVGIRRQIAMGDLAEKMGADFAEMMTWVGSSDVELSGKPFSIYHKWDPVRKIAEYTVAVPVGSVPEGLPDGMSGGAVPACDVYPVKHTGPYQNLSNAWASGMMHARSKVFRQDKSVAPFEIYENDPEQVESEDDLVTVVYFPVKS